MLKLYTIPSCFPCKQVETYLHANSIPFEEVDAIEHPEEAIVAKVAGAPTLLVMDGDRETARITGYSPIRLEEVRRLLD